MLQETTAAPVTGGNNAEALTQMGFMNLMEHMTVVNWIVFLVLVLMSVLSVYWIIYNFIKNIRLKKNSDRVIATFWETPNAQDAIRFMEEQPRSEPFSKVALDAAQAAAHHQRHDASRLAETLSRSEFVDRALRQAVTRESLGLEAGLTVLATVGATAPFVGLLGTVWGIYGALSGIAGQSGGFTIDKVAGPVGEALVMTAFGLAVAIPAVLAYNVFGRVIGRVEAELEGFVHDLLGSFGSAPAPAAPPPARPMPVSA
jgi:biopolymer transport protein ExbB